MRKFAISLLLIFVLINICVAADKYTEFSSPIGFDQFGVATGSAPWTEGEIVWQSDFDNTTDWDNVVSNCTIATYTDTDANQFSQTDGKTLKITTSATPATVGYVYSDTFSPVKDFSKCWFKFNYYLPDQATQPDRLQLNLYTSSGNIYYTYRTPAVAGYHSIEFSPRALSISGTPNLTSVAYIMFLFRSQAASTVIYIDSLQAIYNHPKPRVVLCFDNGYMHQVNFVAPFLESRGVRGCFYVNGNTIDAQYYITSAQLLQMQARGHLIGNHSYSHYYWENETAKYWELIKEIKYNQQILKNIGINEGRFFWAHPGGTVRLLQTETYANFLERIRLLTQYNYHVRLSLTVASLLGATTSFDGTYGTNTGYPVYPNVGGESRIAYTVPGDLPLATCKTYIDQAVLNNALISFTWHAITNDATIPTGGTPLTREMTETDFAELIDYIIAQGCEIVTYLDLMPWNSTQERVPVKSRFLEPLYRKDAK